MADRGLACNAIGTGCLSLVEQRIRSLARSTSWAVVRTPEGLVRVCRSRRGSAGMVVRLVVGSRVIFHRTAFSVRLAVGRVMVAPDSRAFGPAISAPL